MVQCTIHICLYNKNCVPVQYFTTKPVTVTTVHRLELNWVDNIHNLSTSRTQDVFEEIIST